MKAVFRIFKNKWVVQLIGVIALCILLWVAGPMVTVAGKVPLGPVIHRVFVLLLVGILWLACNLIALIRSNKTDQKMMVELSAPEVDPAESAITEAQEEEAGELQQKFTEALRLLKETQSKSRHTRQYLYNLPWYVVIGAPGSGKTTLLMNSGMRFPLHRQLGESTVQGIGGTRNCTWLFSDDAIFIDTAGRYTTQDSHQQVDAAAWSRFLELTKKYRPQRPINGVLVTLSISDLLNWTEVELHQYAGAVHERMMELYRVLGIRFPVYLLLTKTDLIAGFTEFFEDFNRKQREQVWGDSFPLDDAAHSANLRRFEEAFDDLLHRLSERTLRRIHDERDIQRRGMIMDFPQQVALLKTSLIRFLNEAFAASRYETEPFLRGVYFTSGTQEGTPIDRVMSRLAGVYGFDRQKLPIFSGRGKSFFITRLLKEVIFQEAELAGVDARMIRRKRWLQWATYASVAGLIGVMFTLWSVSYAGNKITINRVKKQIDQYEHIEKEVVSGRDAEARYLLVRLDLLHDAGDVYERRPWWEGFGLYQGSKLKSGIRRVYRQALAHDLLPVVQNRVAYRMQRHLRGNTPSDLEVLYEYLRVYLMLGLPEKMDVGVASQWIQRDLQQAFHMEPQLQLRFAAHLDNLLKSPLEPRPLNRHLIAQARQKLNAVPLSLQIYTHLKSGALHDTSNDFYVKDVLGQMGAAVFVAKDGQPIEALKIPGFYTKSGYGAVFEKRGLAVIDQALSQNWILENPAADNPDDQERLYNDLQKLYFADYERIWREMLENMRIRNVRNMTDAIQVLDQLSAPETPLRPLLQTVESHTVLAKKTEPDTPDKTEEKSGINLFARPESKPVEKVVIVPESVRRLERSFKDLNKMVLSTNDLPPPLDQVILRLEGLRDFMMQTSGAANSEEQALQIARDRMGATGAGDIIRQSKMEFSHLPEPLRSWVLPLTSFSWKATLDTAKSELNSIWKTDVMGYYKASLHNRYPLKKNSPHDATLADFSRFFAPGGIMDQFFQQHIRPFVDITGTEWRQVSMDNLSMGLSGAVLKQFQYADIIKKNFFADGGQTPSMQFELKPVYLDSNVSAFRLNLEGQITVYRQGPPQPQLFQWPGPQTNAGVRITFVTIDGDEISRGEEGPWAWMRMLNRAVVKQTSVPDRFEVTFMERGHEARYEVRARSVFNPLRAEEVHFFRCPESL